MPKLTLNTIGSRYGSIDALNDNFDAIEAAFENTLSRDGTSPNNLDANLDADSNRIINLGAPVNNADAATKLYVDDITGNIESSLADIETVADNIASVVTTATNIANINTVANDLNEGVSEIDTVANNIANVNSVGTNIANVNSVAGNSANINTVATNIASVNTTATNIAAIIAAPTEAANAAASAAAAAASAASGMYSAVQDKSANYTVVAADAGDLIRVSTGSGAITITLPQISTQVDGFKVAVVKWSGDANAVTVQRSGTDLINGATTFVLDAQYKNSTFVADFETNTWFASGTGSAGTNIVIDSFNGTGAQTDFTLSGDPGSENNTQVFVSGVYQEKDTYSVSGSTLTFSAAPPSGTSNIEVVWSAPLAIGVPSDGTVSTAKIADSAVTLAKIQNIGTNQILGRDTAGTGVVEQLSATTARTVIGANNASNLNTGTVGTARLATGTANNTTFLRGDQTWAAPPAPSTADVLTATAGASIGGVGTYALLDVVGAAATTEGDTAAGSGLAYSGVLAAYGHGSSTAGSLVATAGANPSGTWRCMGRTGYTVTATVTNIRIATLWLRIS